MYPNPFDRKHSTIRQVIDKFLRPDGSRKSKNWSPKSNLRRYDSSSSSSSSVSSSSSSTASSRQQQPFLFAIKT